jgi:hypothetical protein
VLKTDVYVIRCKVEKVSDEQRQRSRYTIKS